MEKLWTMEESYYFGKLSIYRVLFREVSNFILRVTLGISRMSLRLNRPFFLAIVPAPLFEVISPLSHHYP